MPAAGSLRTLDEGLSVRLDAHGAAGLEDWVVRRGHSSVAELTRLPTYVVRPV